MSNFIPKILDFAKDKDKMAWDFFKYLLDIVNKSSNFDLQSRLDIAAAADEYMF
jgi:hypothetical protein